MASTPLEFTKQVDDWTKKTEARMLAVFKQSTQTLTNKIQSRVPVDTGFAKASIMASLSAMPKIDSSKKGGSSLPSGNNVTSVIASAKMGDTVYVGWTASYVQYLEWGHSKQAPQGFVGITSLEWPQIVATTIAQAKVEASK